ncbi:hypothetical protein [Micromonospora sp. NPDC049891]|uniref:hypothetical protein n=1 Tax=Micromonospora sp. NPDC049891 TaxID=3155655 RepID=UPI003409B31E
MTDTTRAADDYTTSVLTSRWTAVPEDTLGGWCVTCNGLTPANGGVTVADMVTRELAERIAELHNAALDGRLLPAGTDTVEQFNTRLYRGDTLMEEPDTAQTRAHAQARVDWHDQKRAEDPSWPGRAVLVRRFQHTTPFEPVEVKP